MHFSTMTPILVLLLAAVASYVITRRIGHLRRQIGALLVSLALGVVGGVVGGLFDEAAYETALVISVTAAIVGGLIGIVLGRRRRNPPSSPKRNRKPGVGVPGDRITVSAAREARVRARAWHKAP